MLAGVHFQENEEFLRFVPIHCKAFPFFFVVLNYDEKEIDTEIFVEEKAEDSNFWTLYEEHIRPFELIETNFEIENDVDVQIGWYSEDIDPINS